MNFYRKKDSELVTGSAVFAAAIAATPVVFGLVAAQATAYGVLDTAFATDYATANEPATRTKSAVAAKNQSRKNLVAGATQLADYIIRNPAVSNAQLIDLGLDPRTERTPVPPPTGSPSIDFKAVDGRIVTLRLHGRTGRGKPAGVAGVAIFSHVGATPPASISDWKFEGNAGRTTVAVAFDDSVPAGSLVWFTAFWFNNRKQSGPACDPVSINIAGGGVSMAA